MAEHLDILLPNGGLLGTMNRGELLKSYLHGPAFTGWYEGTIVVIAGITILWPGHGEAWALFSKNFKDHKYFIHRESLRHIRWLAAKHNLRRIQASSLQENEAANRWLEHLGFKPEGEMPEYWQGKTFTRWGRIFSWV
jgi:hypothetical protein